MNSRGLQTLTHRGNGLVNGTIHPTRKQACSSFKPEVVVANGRPQTPVRSISCNRPLRSTAIRPSRTTTAVNAPPRKSSAPPKLLSGGSLDALPDTVTVRRKVSTPVKPANHTGTASVARTTKHPVKRASSITAPSNTKKKFSAPAKITTDSQRMSKDHTGSAGSQNASGCSGTGSKGSATNSSATGAPARSSEGEKCCVRKGPYAIPEVEPLPTLKEEKKSKLKSKKMSAACEDSAGSFPGEVIQDVGQELGPHQAPTPLPPAPPEEMAVDDPLAKGAGADTERTNLERMVSDLIKNNESKKQEIAALKMEINRLKEAARERVLQATTVECPPKEQSFTPLCEKKEPPTPEWGRCCEGPVTSKTKLEEEEELGRLEAMVDALTVENRLLRDHLQQLGVSLDASPLSDQQKEMILSRVSAFAQGGGCAENLSSSAGGEREWDNKSTSSISEISVACLQGRIQQMEETHYSTNEELQATLQELEDLREQLSECQMEVQQLQEEKQVILESLTQQTEKLNEARGYNDTLKLMLIQQSENSQDVSQCERTQRLMELLKNVQEDKELVQVKQDEMDQQMQASKEAEEHFHREAQLIRDRMKLLETMVEAATNDKKTVESQLFEAQEIIKATEKESARLKGQLTTAKEKITDLEAAVISGEKSELADVLERVCSEKESSEREVSNLQRKVNNLVCENDRLKDQVTALQDNLRVTRNNAKTNLDDVEWRRTQLDERRRELELEIETLKATLADAQMTCQHHLEDKRELKANLSEAQKKMTEMGERQAEAERGFAEERAAFSRQVEEWEQFQKDLLTSVRVANDFKTEAQRGLEKIEHENQMLKERLRQLDVDLERARGKTGRGGGRFSLPIVFWEARSATSKLPSPANSLSTVGALSGTSSLGGVSTGDRRLYKGVLPNGESILGDRRGNPRPLARGDSRVKSLIESIECATKQTKANSRSSSTSSLASNGSENNGCIKAQLRRAETEGMIRNLPASFASISSLKESMTNNSASPLRALNCNTITDSLNSTYSTKSNPNTTNLPDTVKMSQLSSEKNASAKFGSSYSTTSGLGVDSVPKSVSILGNKMEPIRRNSYNQISLLDKKDPLANLSQSGGSRRNALLKWCQNKTSDYKGVDITNFSSSWNDGLAFCALLDTYMPDKIGYSSLNLSDKRRNFEIAFAAAESVGITTSLDVNDLITLERPSWQSVFNYVTSIYSHFET